MQLLGFDSKKSIIIKDDEGNSVIKVSDSWSNQALINNSKYKKKYKKWISLFKCQVFAKISCLGRHFLENSIPRDVMQVFEDAFPRYPAVVSRKKKCQTEWVRPEMHFQQKSRIEIRY